MNDEDIKKWCSQWKNIPFKKIINNNLFPDYIKYLQSIGVDALIVADIGVMKVIQQVAPNMPIHVSTQANITNKYTAKAFADMGAKRLILARELSIDEVKEIRDFIPKDVEIECFVHGAMCISYSGRCLLSNYFCGRDANHGECVQACRWDYAICRKDKTSEKFEILEDNRGSYILNSKDMNMIEYLDKLSIAQLLELNDIAEVLDWHLIGRTIGVVGETYKDKEV